MHKYIPIIGLEIHVELKTKSKMFCQCDASYFNKDPNSNTCPVCLGLPGAIPVPNKKAIDWTVKLSLALNCKINEYSYFDRKHYFYPDLPKGYQISQYLKPIGFGGYLKVRNKSYSITRVHLEEDTGKLIHTNEGSLIDFNRSGVPLVEIVTGPVFHSSDDVKGFLQELHRLIKWIDISDADLEKGSMRMEPNISLKNVEQKKDDNTLPKYKVEIKNINSFRFVKQAIDFEIDRQTEILNIGKLPNQETRGFDENKQVTYSQRSKGEADDYRYLPEPDIPPFNLAETKNISQKFLKEEKLPSQFLEELEDKFLIPYEDSIRLLENKWLIVRLYEIFKSYEKEYLNKDKLLITSTNPYNNKTFAHSIASLIKNKKISIKKESNIKSNLEDINNLLEIKSLSGDEIKKIIKEVLSIEKNSQLISSYKKGKTQAINPLIGQVIQSIGKRTDVKTIKNMLERFLNE